MRARVSGLFLLITSLMTVTVAIAGGSSFSHGLIQSSCAPWDGPAVQITLTAETPQCDRAPSGPYISMGVWRGFPLHDGQVVTFGSGSDNGFASRCAKDNDCQRAESGTIMFEKYNEDSRVLGHYELHFKGGETVSGRFDVAWCKTRVICG